MYKSVLRLTALVFIFGTSMWADSITIDGASSTSMLGTWFGGRGFFPIIPVVATTTTPTATSPNIPPSITAPIVEAVSTATNGASGTSVNVFGSYNSTLYGEGISYTNGSVTGNPVSLSSASAFTYSGYLTSLPTTANLSGATLNLSLLIGGPTAGVLGSTSATASLAGALGPLSVTISSGGVSRTLTGADLNGYDLFANGFGAQILSGAALSLTFNAADQVTPTVSVNSPVMFGGSGRGFYFVPGATTVNLSDTRDITGSNLSNYLTLVYTSTTASGTNASPAIVPYFGDAPEAIFAAANPEPAPTILVGGGMLLIGYLRWKKNRKKAAQIV